MGRLKSGPPPRKPFPSIESLCTDFCTGVMRRMPARASSWTNSSIPERAQNSAQGGTHDKGIGGVCRRRVWSPEVAYGSFQVKHEDIHGDPPSASC